MIKALIDIFRDKNEVSTEKYSGLSDFFLRAPAKEKREVIGEAARKANEDQYEVFEKARLK